MFDELVIMTSSELKSGFQFNHGIKNKKGFKPDQLIMHDEKTNAKIENYRNDKVQNARCFM